jgi:hypothetical protein
MSTTSLPQISTNDSGADTKLFFDGYGQAPLEFNANDVAVTVSFFQKKGFSIDAANVVASALLKQAKLDAIPITKILDSLVDADKLSLGRLVGEILNNNRTPTSTLGFKSETVRVLQSRNIAP